jgi:hypothetical protein
LLTKNLRQKDQNSLCIPPYRRWSLHVFYQSILLIIQSYEYYSDE